ncbi:MAG: penicillin-binding protein 1C [Acetobacteraceae bacterium]
MWRLAAAAGLGVAALLAGAAGIADRLYPPELARLPEPVRLVQDRNGAPIAAFLGIEGIALDWNSAAIRERVNPLGQTMQSMFSQPEHALRQQWTLRMDRSAAPLFFRRLLIAAEDRYFYDHPGVNPLAVLRATAQLLMRGHVVSGASTLAMQVARLLHPRPRTLTAKIIEALRALQLTVHFSHRKILRLWLDLAPFGSNVVGLRTASWMWFGKPPGALDPAEIALLVALPERPEALRPDKHPQAARRARARLLALAVGRHLLRPRAAAEADREPLPQRLLPLPDAAPAALAPLVATRAKVRTTLDAGLETALGRLARATLTTVGPRVSLAVVIAEAKTGKIRAIFAGDWANPGRAGFLDLTRAVRSPGSTLKPFVYALAFGDGIAAPDTLLDDIPRHFGAYAPEDFDHVFAGRVTAREALRESLNVPAVWLLARLGAASFVADLAAAGEPVTLPAGAQPSLSVVLGGCGVTLRRLVALYGALATDGAVRALSLLAGTRFAVRRLLPPGAAASVANILTRPFPFFGPQGIAWKTGTSAGNRDRWAIGFDRRMVVGVWVGRPDGTPLPGGPSADLALPLLARIFGLLPAAPRSPMPLAGALALAKAPRAEALSLLFPPPGSVLWGLDPVRIRAMGGTRPLTFLVDGRKLRSLPALRATGWTPPGPGFYRITVLDAAGRAAGGAIRVKRVP